MPGDMFGYSFTPDLAARFRSSLNNPTGASQLPQNVGQALQVLSLHLPSFVGGSPIAPDALLRPRAFTPDAAVRAQTAGTVAPSPAAIPSPAAPTPDTSSPLSVMSPSDTGPDMSPSASPSPSSSFDMSQLFAPAPASTPSAPPSGPSSGAPPFFQGPDTGPGPSSGTPIPSISFGNKPGTPEAPQGFTPTPTTPGTGPDISTSSSVGSGGGEPLLNLIDRFLKQVR